MIDTEQMAKYIFEEYANCYSEVDIKKLAKHLEEIKAEAVKEFAEKLKHSFFDNGYESPDIDFDYFVDNLVKEMVGDSNE